MSELAAKGRLGSVLAGKYRLDAILGSGTYGVVYAGRHELTDRPIAVKVLRSFEEKEESALAKERFLREAKAAASLGHLNVVEVIDLGQSEEDGVIFQVLELLEGEPLSDLLEREGKIPFELAWEILAPIMSALASAHEAGIVHRDLKPSNIFLSQDKCGRLIPKLLDFGTAKIATAGRLTQTGAMVGTPAFMAPEQARAAKSIGPEADVWAMGVLFFRALSGRLPFGEGKSRPMELVLELMNKEPPRLAEVAPELDPAVAEAVQGALQKEPKERYRSMRAFASALAEAAGVDGGELTAQKPKPSAAFPSAKGAGGSRLVIGLLVALVIALAAGLAWALLIKA